MKGRVHRPWASVATLPAPKADATPLPMFGRRRSKGTFLLCVYIRYMRAQQFSLWLPVSIVRYGVVVRAVRVESHLGRFYPPDREV